MPSQLGKLRDACKQRIKIQKGRRVRRGGGPACALVLSNRSIMRSALLRSSPRSSSSWLIRPWEKMSQTKSVYTELRCRVCQRGRRDGSVRWCCSQENTLRSYYNLNKHSYSTVTASEKTTDEQICSARRLFTFKLMFCHSKVDGELIPENTQTGLITLHGKQALPRTKCSVNSVHNGVTVQCFVISKTNRADPWPGSSSASQHLSGASANTGTWTDELFHTDHLIKAGLNGPQLRVLLLSLRLGKIHTLELHLGKL